MAIIPIPLCSQCSLRRPNGKVKVPGALYVGGNKIGGGQYPTASQNEAAQEWWSNENRSVGLMVIGEAPGATEFVEKEPFVGESGNILHNAFRQAGTSLRNWPGGAYVTNACMCRPSGNAKPGPGDIQACKGRLLAEIEAVRPQKIALFGATALEALASELDWPLTGGVMMNHGGYVRSTKLGVPVMISYHPALILHTDDTVYRDLLWAIRKLRVAPKTVFWPSEDGDGGSGDGWPHYPYDVFSDPEEAAEYLEAIATSPYKVTMDIETTNVDVRSSGLLSVGFIEGRATADGSNRVGIIPVSTFIDESVFDAFQELATGKGLVVQNGDFEYTWMRYWWGLPRGVEMKVANDTMLAHYAGDERSGDDDSKAGRGASYHGLKTLGRLWYDAPDWSKAMKAYGDDYGKAPKDVLYRYQALDIAVTSLLDGDLVRLLEIEVQREPGKIAIGAVKALNEVMVPNIPMLAEMEYTGICIDVDYLKDLAKDWEEDCKAQLQEIRELAGLPGFLVTSPKQVAALLYDTLKLKQPKGVKMNKNAKNPERSTSKHVLKAMEEKYQNIPILQKIAELRSTMHILAKDIKGLMESTHPQTGRVHTRFLQHGSATGRLSSKDPALQNIPARIGGVIRDAFVATEGYELLQADYKQAELKVAACASMDPELIALLNSGRDIHNEIACEYFNCRPEEVDKPRRLDAKAVVFGILYGRGASSIASEFKLSMDEAKRRIQVIANRFPRLFEWIGEMQAIASKQGYVESIFGRRRRFPYREGNQLKAAIERYAVNSPVQSAASDICTTGSRLVRKRLQEVSEELGLNWRRGLGVGRGLLLVHDSNLLEFRIDMGGAKKWAPLVVECMEQPPFEGAPVKFDVDVEIGFRWGSLKKYEGYKEIQ